MKVGDKIKNYKEELQHMQNEYKIKLEAKKKQFDEIISVENKYQKLLCVNQELNKNISDLEAKNQNDLAYFTKEKEAALIQNIELAQELKNLTDKSISLSNELINQKMNAEGAQRGSFYIKR